MSVMTTTLNPPRHDVAPVELFHSETATTSTTIESAPTEIEEAAPPVGPQTVEIRRAGVTVTPKRQPIARQIVAELADLLRLSPTPSHRALHTLDRGALLHHR